VVLTVVVVDDDTVVVVVFGRQSSPNILSIEKFSFDDLFVIEFD
jgi:hypothetical protein